MLECYMKKVPEGTRVGEYISEIERRLDNDYAEDAENYSVELANELNFDECWDLQENLKRTDEIKQKYYALMKEGKVVYIEIEW
jgi:hypothetical protein